MKSLYAILDILAVLGPLALSFDRRVRYLEHWKSILLASILVAIPFVLHDSYFTQHAIWGFNPDYLIGIEFFHLPIEEWSFFVIVPFCCYFIYQCCQYYFKKPRTKVMNRIVQFLILVYIAFVLFNPTAGIYSYWVSCSSFLVLTIWFVATKNDHQGLSFLISLIPFLLMNGALTGSFTEEPIVWYEETAKVAGRIGTIPFEDVLYAFTLIISVNLLAPLFKK